MQNLNHSVHLVGRHPEIVNNQKFQEWHRQHGSQIWHETHPDEQGYVSVVVQSLDKHDLIAFLIRKPEEKAEQQSPQAEVVDIATFDLVKERSTEGHALEAAEGQFQKQDIQAVRPVIDWKAKTLKWELEVNDGANVHRYFIDEKQKLTPFNKVHIDRLEKINIQVTNTDWLEENELHHLNRYHATAVEWARGGATVADKAFRIWLKVKQRMVYDGNVRHIGEFVWADNLVIDTLGYRGICDEWAVLQITMLRALGIPSTMKFMIFNYNGSQVGHACLEWSDNGTWKHMDALWNAYDNKAVYRQNGASNVTVMDATSPRDSRYGGTAWGVPDVHGDGKLYPYGDYLISPAYPGNSRPGYSY